MTARQPYEPGAGNWVAYRDEPKRRFNPETKRYENVPGTRRVYLYNAETGVTMVGSPATCVRFHTREEALRAAKARWPRVMRGHRIGAEKVETPA